MQPDRRQPPRPEHVDDFDDPRLADYRNLKDANLRLKRKRFIVEGRGNLRVLLARSRFRPESILLNQAAWAALESVLVDAAPGCPVYVAEQAVFDRVAGLAIHRGCLAACARGGEREPIELARELLDRLERPRVLVLESILDPDNVGSIFRNAMALGAGAVFLCPRTCDPLYRKAIRTSMGGTLCVPFARFADVVKGLAELRMLGFEILALDPDESALPYRSLEPGDLGPLALLLGTEGTGLTEPALHSADRRVRIPMERGVDSLNVSVAAGIALSWFRAPNDSGDSGSRSEERSMDS